MVRIQSDSVTYLLSKLTDAPELDDLLGDIGYTLVRDSTDHASYFAERGSDSGPKSPLRVNTLEKQRRLFFLHASGELNAWDDESKQYAKRWAAVLATTFEKEEAQRVQLSFTLERLARFCLPSARAVFAQRTTTWSEVAYAAYLSFAANNPTIANKKLQEHCRDRGTDPNDPDWVFGLLQRLTFGPKIAIYPHRYDSIRPVLERCFAVDLPDFASELKAFQEDLCIDPEHSQEERLDTPMAIQRALACLGYDVGPVDGIFGKKSKQAVIQFQLKSGLTSDGVVGPKTRKALLSEYLRKVENL